MNRARAIELTGQFMLLEGMNDLDFFVCGSVRRDEEEVGDVDLIVVGEFPSSDKYCERFRESGGNKTRTYNYHTRQINMWITKPHLLGAAVLYATGSGKFNQRLRQMCIRKGLKLSQNGLVTRDKKAELIAGSTEKGIFNKLGLKYIPPPYRDSKRMRTTLEAFKLRSQSDRSYEEPILGRVFDRSIYAKNQQNMLPMKTPEIDLEKGLFYTYLLRGK